MIVGKCERCGATMLLRKGDVSYHCYVCGRDGTSLDAIRKWGESLKQTKEMLKGVDE